MKLKIRNFLGNFYFIHFEVLLGLFALLGYILSGIKSLIFFIALSFSGAICGSFIRVIDSVYKNKSNL